MIQKNIRKLVQYGLQTGLITEADKIYTTNRLLELFELDELEESDADVTMGEEELENVLSEMMDYAYEHGIMTENSIVYRDLFDTKIMSMLVPRPSEVISVFEAKYKSDPKDATDYFYKLSQDTDYIVSRKTRNGLLRRNTVIWILRLICRNRRKIPRRLPQRRARNRAVIRNACSVLRMKDMRVVLTIRQGRIIE